MILDYFLSEFEPDVVGVSLLIPGMAVAHRVMEASLPVIASNFPLWMNIVEGNKCSICVDPFKPHKIAKAIEYLMEHPKLRKEMGENGRNAVLEKYNWEKESEKLINLYGELLKNDH